MTTVKIISITVLKQQYTPDNIALHMDIPSGTWPYKGKATATIIVAENTGENYVKKHFSEITPTVIILPGN
jgi:hypothetical protein